MCQGKLVLSVFKRSSKNVSGKFQFCFKEVSKEFQGSFKEVQKCFKVDSMVFQESFKGVSRKSGGVLRKNRAFERSFKGSFKCAYRAYVSRKFSGCFKEVSRDFQRSLKGVTFDVSIVFQSS